MSNTPAFAKRAFILYYAGFVVNGLASLITLCLMFSMWRAGRLKLNLYTKCAIQMSFLMFMYEVSAPVNSAALLAAPFATGAALGYPPTAIIVGTGGVFLGGLGASVWSMMMLLSAIFTVQYSRQPTSKEQLITCVVVNLLLIAFAIQAMVRTDLEWYSDNPSRKNILNDYLMSRVVFIVLSAICLLRLCQVMLLTSTKGERFRSPLFHLLRKIAPYTIILAVVRFAASQYPWIYGGHATQIPANADGMQIFSLYVFVLLTPAASLGLLVAFINVTAGAKRSLIQMLHLECIFTLPDAPASWAEKNNINLRFNGESTMRPTVVQEEHDRLITMDEHDLAVAVASNPRDATENTGRMSEQEEGARKVDFNAGLNEI